MRLAREVTSVIMGQSCALRRDDVNKTASALEGIRVLDLSRLLPGPWCSMVLADLGADVIKVEEPNIGDYIRWFPPRLGDQSAMFVNLNRNKRSITLNLRAAQGRDAFRRLAEKADVVLEGFRPGVMDRLGLGYAQLSALNPRLIYCSLTGYGQDGPYADRVGHDINYIGYAGVLGITGHRGGPPVVPGVQIADIGGGGMLATIGILAALMARERTGRGQFVDISMLDGVVSWLVLLGSAYFASGQQVRRGELLLSGAIPGYQVYETKDGKYLAAGALEEKFWRNLYRELGLHDLDDEPMPTGERWEQKWDDVRQRMQAVFLTKTRDEWLELLQDKEVCVGPVYDFEEVFTDPQVLHRQMVWEVEHPGVGLIKQIANPVKLSETPPDYRRPAPRLGQHTDEVLSEAGFTPEEIASLRAGGIV